MWCKITGQLSHNNPRLRLYLSPNYFHRRETKPAEKNINFKSFTFSSLSLYMEEKITRFVESSNSDTKKLI